MNSKVCVETRKNTMMFFIPFLLISIFIYSFYLSNTYVYGIDELFYMESPREMIENNNYTIPYFKNEIRIRKPILFYWVVTASYKLFGESVISARLPSLIMSFFGLLLVYRLYLLLFGNDKGAIYSVIVLLSSFHYFYHARMSSLDMSLTFFILLSVYYAAKGIFRDVQDNSFIASAFFAGLATCTKGPIGLMVPYMTVAGICFSIKSYRPLLIKYFHPKNVIVTLLVGFGWYIFILFKLGFKDFYHVFVIELSSRVSDNNLSIYKNLFRHITNIVRVMFPWPLLCIPAFMNYKTLRAATSKRDFVSVRFCLAYILSVFVIFLFVFPYYARYLLPMVPPCAVFVGYVMSRLEDLFIFKLASFRFVYYFILAFVYLVAAVSFVCLLVSYKYLPDIFSTFVYLFLLSLLGIVSLSLSEKSSSFEGFLITTAMFMLGVFSLVFYRGVPYFRQTPFCFMASEYIAEMDKNDLLITIGPDKKARNWITFLGKHVIDKSFDKDSIENAAQVRHNINALTKRGVKYVILPQKMYNGLEKQNRAQFVVLYQGYKYKSKIKMGDAYSKVADLGLVKAIENFREGYVLVREVPNA